MKEPFLILQKPHISRLLELNRIYLVTQTYMSPFTSQINEGRTKFIVTDYEDKGMAITHSRALQSDKYAAVLDLSNTVHLNKLYELIAPESNYILFWAVVKNKELFEKQINIHYKEAMKKYITRNTRWRIDRDTTLYPKLELIYGELFINLRYGNDRLRIKFAELVGYSSPTMF